MADVYLRPEYFGCLAYVVPSGRYFEIASEDADELRLIGRSAKVGAMLFADVEGLDATRDIQITTLDTRPVASMLSAPLKVFFNITKRCNLYCRHCYNKSGESDSPELPASVVLATLRELPKAGIFKVTLAGGEPLFHRDAAEVLGFLMESPLCTSIVTNGIPLSEAKLQVLSNLPKRSSITISLDGATSEDNDHVRGVGSFDRTVHGIRQILKWSRCSVSVRLTITKYCLNSLNEFVALLVDLGVKELKVNRVNAYGRAIQNLDLIAHQSEYLIARDQLLELCEMHGMKLEIPSYKYQVNDKGEIGLCKAGVETFEIDGDGTVYPCSFSFGRFGFGSVNRESLREILGRMTQFSINNDWCYSCKGRGGKQEKTIGYIPKLITIASHC